MKALLTATFAAVLASTLAHAQGSGVNAALGQPAASKVAAPAATATVKPGEGGGPSAATPSAPPAPVQRLSGPQVNELLASTINPMVRAGASAIDVARVLRDAGAFPSDRFDLSTARFVTRNGFAYLGFLTLDGGAQYFGTPEFRAAIEAVHPPASLPNGDEVLGPPANRTQVSAN